MENRCLEFIGQLKPNEHMFGGDLYNDIISFESKRKATAELIVDVKKLDRSMQSDLTYYTRFSNFASKVFQILRRMGIIPIYHTSLGVFIPFFKKSLMDSEGSKAVSSACKALLRNVHSYYASSFSKSDRTYFSFAIAAEYVKTFEASHEKFRVKDHHWLFFLNGELPTR